MPKAKKTTISPAGLDPATSARTDAVGQSPGAVGQNWSVYVIRRQIDGRAYVGLTKRPLPVRIAMHDLLARRRPHLGGPGSLAEAIRQARAQGRSITEAFQVEVLAETSSAEEARRLERRWIARLATARPGGFNLIRGGSLGGPANAEPVRVDHPSRGVLQYPSLMTPSPT